MGRYIPADKLIAEIKGLQCEQGFDTGEAERAYQFAIKDILASIDSLQQEQPEVDLDKELKNKKATLLDDAFGPMNGEQSLAIRNFARYFYELGKIARKEK